MARAALLVPRRLRHRSAGRRMRGTGSSGGRARQHGVTYASLCPHALTLGRDPYVLGARLTNPLPSHSAVLSTFMIFSSFSLHSLFYIKSASPFLSAIRTILFPTSPYSNTVTLFMLMNRYSFEHDGATDAHTDAHWRVNWRCDGCDVEVRNLLRAAACCPARMSCRLLWFSF